MTVDYLKNANEFPEDSILRISNFNIEEFKKFKDLILKVLQDKVVCLSELDFLKPNNIDILFVIYKKNLGLVQTEENTFICLLTYENYIEMIDIMEKYIDYNLDGFAWLYTIESKINFLVSVGGGW